MYFWFNCIDCCYNSCIVNFTHLLAAILFYTVCYITFFLYATYMCIVCYFHVRTLSFWFIPFFFCYRCDIFCCFICMLAGPIPFQAYSREAQVYFSCDIDATIKTLAVGIKKDAISTDVCYAQ
jgi:hypothetical protein